MVLPSPARLQRLEHAFDVCNSVLALGVPANASPALAVLDMDAPPAIFVRRPDGSRELAAGPLETAAMMILGRAGPDALAAQLRQLKSHLAASGFIMLPFRSGFSRWKEQLPTSTRAALSISPWRAAVAISGVETSSLYPWRFDPRSGTAGIGFVLGSTRPLVDRRHRDTIGRVATDYLR